MIEKQLQAKFVKEIRDKARLSQRKFAEILNCSGAYIGQVETGETYLSEKIYKEIIKNFAHLANDKQDDCINIPVRGEVESSMGYGVMVYDETQTSTYAFSRKLAQDLGINLEESQIIFGRGNSMEPTIQGGDSLLVDLSKKEIIDGNIYCIRYDGQLLTKRLQKISRSHIKIISDNKDYDPILIDFKKEINIDFEIIGEVRWAGRVFR